jgi:hypothetical protein
MVSMTETRYIFLSERFETTLELRGSFLVCYALFLHSTKYESTIKGLCLSVFHITLCPILRTHYDKTVQNKVCLISKFRLLVNAVFLFVGDSLASEFYVGT